jgi:hypothetical protein
MRFNTRFIKQLFFIACISIWLFGCILFANYFMYINYHLHLETGLPWIFFKH